MRQHLSTAFIRPIFLRVFPSFWALLLGLNSYAETPVLGDQIKINTVEVKDEVWPRVEAKVLIRATSLTSAAIFAAYDYQKNYIPNLKVSEVTFEQVSGAKNSTHVTYVMDMPWPIGDSKYVHGHELTGPKKDSYDVRWFMVKSDSAENVRGHALFEPHPSNPEHTLMTYVSLVTPKSFLAGIFKKIMVGDVLKSIKAIRSTTEELKRTNPSLVKKYEDKIKNVLAGKKAYLN